MRPTKAIAWFCGRFLLLFGLMLIPWPGWPGACNGYFRTVGTFVFDSKTGLRSLDFEPQEPHDTRIVIINRDLLQRDGSGPVRNLDLDSFDFLWRPMSLLLALVLASPVSWRRRAWALAAGGICLHLFLFLVLDFAIWTESADVGLVSFSPFWKKTCGEILHLLIGQLNIAAPFLIWAVMTFRREDFQGFLNLETAGEAADFTDE
jgi:hypothetical protein